MRSPGAIFCLVLETNFNFQIVSSSAVFVLTACTLWISLEPKTQFHKILRDIS